MDEFTTFVNMAKDVANATVKKTGEIFGQSKIRIKIAALNADVENAYAKLGAGIYNAVKNGTDNEAIIASAVAEIDVLIDELAHFKKKLSELQKNKICGVCSAKSPAEAKFCVKCGRELSGQDPEVIRVTTEFDSEEFDSEEFDSDDEKN